MRRFALIVAALPFALLAGCGSKDKADNVASANVATAPPPAGQNWIEVVSQTPEGGYRMGNPNAPLKLVEYGSRTCPTCGRFGQEGMEPLEQNYVATGKLSYEFRDFLVHGPPDLAAALIGHCVEPSAFFPFLEQMYLHQDDVLKREQDKGFPPVWQSIQGQPPQVMATKLAEYLGYIDFARQRGLPEAKARACLADPKRIDALAKMTRDAGDSGKVTGTPTFYLNDRKLDAAVWSDVEAEIKKAGA